MSKAKPDKTEELIQVLSADLKKGSLNLSILFLSWMGLLVSGILLGWSVSLLTNRPVFPGWWPEPVLVVAWGAFSGYFLSRLAYPEENSIWMFWGAGASIFLWIGYNIVRFFTEFDLGHVHIGFCPGILAISSVLFGTLGSFLLSKMSSSRPGLSAFLFLSLLFASSNIGLKFVCPVQDASHIFLSHVVFTLTWIGLFWIPVRKKFSW
ncbi:DUF1109 family protein [Leptospira sarikeiensis]|uniref:DUF1109 family protein n=1 Tax=Leptospira sarikeiensis TaxID=2484943 RepID=A0A4R9K1N4_9LEPT|nr:DUF1109 family protein [Leptospira sarikeiensis]TGL59613.1 DUF1109 family protein [Leptospira sarikeiensis]